MLANPHRPLRLLFFSYRSVGSWEVLYQNSGAVCKPDHPSHKVCLYPDILGDKPSHSKPILGRMGFYIHHHPFRGNTVCSRLGRVLLICSLSSLTKKAPITPGLRVYMLLVSTTRWEYHPRKLCGFTSMEVFKTTVLNGSSSNYSNSRAWIL